MREKKRVPGIYCMRMGEYTVLFTVLVLYDVGHPGVSVSLHFTNSNFELERKAKPGKSGLGTRLDQNTAAVEFHCCSRMRMQ